MSEKTSPYSTGMLRRRVELSEGVDDTAAYTQPTHAVQGAPLAPAVNDTAAYADHQTHAVQTVELTPALQGTPLPVVEAGVETSSPTMVVGAPHGHLIPTIPVTSKLPIQDPPSEDGPNDVARTPGDDKTTGVDNDKTGADKDKTGADKDKTGTDKDKTGADKDKTGTDKDKNKPGDPPPKNKEVVEFDREAYDRLRALIDDIARLTEDALWNREGYSIGPTLRGQPAQATWSIASEVGSSISQLATQVRTYTDNLCKKTMPDFTHRIQKSADELEKADENATTDASG